MAFWRFRGALRRAGKPPAPALILVIFVALTSVMVARAYTSSEVGSATRAYITEDDAGARLAVETFAPAIAMSEESFTTMAAAAAGPEGENSAPGEEATAVDMLVLRPVLGVEPCGLITNNFGHDLWDLTVESMGDAVVTLDTTRLYPGDSAALLCNLTGLSAGGYVWEGNIVASWPSGRARVPFTVEFWVPEETVIANTVEEPGTAPGGSEQESTLSEDMVPGPEPEADISDSPQPDSTPHEMDDPLADDSGQPAGEPDTAVDEIDTSVDTEKNLSPAEGENGGGDEPSSHMHDDMHVEEGDSLT